MKKLVSALLCLIIALLLAACVKTSYEEVERFTIAAGRGAYIQARDTVMPSASVKLSVPEGTLPVMPYEDAGIIIVSADTDMVDDNFDTIKAFGAADLAGNLLVECVYSEISVSGNFLMAIHDDGEEISYDFYYKDGAKLFATGNVINNFAAIDEDYFAVYTEYNSEVFYKSGAALFGQARQLTSAYHYSLCGEFLLAHEPEQAHYFIYRIVENSILLQKSYMSTVNILYNIGYIGQGDFLISAMQTATAQQHMYSDMIDDSTHYLNQSLKVYNPVSGEKAISSEIIIIGIVNRYTPTILYTERKRLNLKEGYSAAYALKLNSEKARIGQEAYVINRNGTAVVRLHGGLSPFTITYKNDYGFAGNAVSGYSAALFDLSGAALFMKSDSEYYAQSYNNGRYTLAKMTSSGLLYGLLDSNGEAIIDFELQFLATFVSNYSVAKKDDVYFRINANGDLLAVIEDIYGDNTQFVFNCYTYLEDSKIGVKNYAGEVLIQAAYDSVVFRGYVGDKVYILLADGDNTDAFRLE